MKIRKDVELTWQEEMAIRQCLGLAEPKINYKKLSEILGVSLQGAYDIARRYQYNNK
jgi:hypothetical protein